MSADTSRLAICPDDEILGAFATGGLDALTRARIEPHVADCPTCLDVVAAVMTEPATLPAPASAEPSGPTSEARARRPGTAVWRWAVAAAIAVGVSAALLGSVRTFAPPMLARLAVRTLGVPLRADSITTSFGAGVTTLVVSMHGVSAGEESGRRFSADTISLAVRPVATLRGAPLVSDVHIVRPVLSLPGVAMDGPLWDRVENSVLSVFAGADHAQIDEGRIELSAPGEPPLAIVDMNGGAERADGGLRIVLTGEVAGGTIAVTGTLAGDGRRVDLTLGGRRLAAAQLPLLARQLTGDVELRLDVTRGDGAPRVDGRVAIQHGQWRGVNPLAALPAEERALVTTLRPELGGGTLPFDDGRAAFTWRRGRWAFQRVFVSMAGVLAGGRGRVDADGRIDGRGTVRLPVDLAAALAARQPGVASFLDRNGAATIPVVVAGSSASPRFALGTP